MIRNLIIAATMLLSVNAFAAAADLVGKWSTPCWKSPDKYVQSIAQFEGDGTLTITNYFYEQAQCAGPELLSEVYLKASYTATDSTFMAAYSEHGAKIEITYDYSVAGDVMTVKATSVLVDGKPQEYEAEAGELTRIK